MLPLWLPAAVGPKVTEIVQLAVAASVLAQSFVCENSVLFEPIEVMFSVALPVFASVTVCAAEFVPTVCEPKVNELVDSEATAPMPTPVSEIVCGLPEALSATLTEPVRVFAPAGWKVMVSVQLAPTLRLLPQLFVTL